MKKYIVSIIGGSLFVGFVTYATVQTQPTLEKYSANQDANVISSQTSDKKVTLPAKSPSPKTLPTSVVKNPIVPVVVSPVVTNPIQPEITNNKENSKKYYDDEDDGYEEEDDD